MDRVEHALLVATNEGSRYGGFIKTAILDTPKGRATTIGGTELLWVYHARSVIRTMGQWEERKAYTVADALALAVALEAYYREHLGEWTQEDIDAEARKLFIY